MRIRLFPRFFVSPQSGLARARSSAPPRRRPALQGLLTASVALGLSACHTANLPSLGKVDLRLMCDNVKRCDARGDGAFNALKNGPPPYLAHANGPEQYLGKVAPKRKPNSALMSCSAEVTPKDWLSTAPTIREIPLDKEGKQRVRDSLKSHLVEAMDSAGLVESADADLKANVDAAVAAVDFTKASLVEQTYWLKDTAFEKRVGQCGEDFYDQIVYSMTVFSFAELFQKDLELKLGAALAAKLIKSAPEPELPAEAPAPEPPSVALAAAVPPTPPAVAPAPEVSAPVPAEVAPTPAAPVVAEKPKRSKKNAAKAPPEVVVAPPPPEPPQAPPAPVVAVQSPAELATAERETTTRQYQAVAKRAVEELARDSRFVAAFGFDDR